MISMGKGLTERKAKMGIVRSMRSLGTYREEYEPIIDRLAKLYVDYDRIISQYEASGRNPVVKHTNKYGATNLVKNPFLTARDDIYDKILAHERELGLTPASIKRMDRLPNDAQRDDQKDPFLAALENLADSS